jgi:hypothetical protein
MYLLQPHWSCCCIIYAFHPTWFTILSDEKHTLWRSSVWSFLKLGVTSYLLGLKILHGTLSSNILTLCLYSCLLDTQFHIHTKQQVNIFTSYQYNQLGSLVKTSGNFLQMQLHTKNTLVTQSCKVKICDFSF